TNNATAVASGSDELTADVEDPVTSEAPDNPCANARFLSGVRMRGEIGYGETGLLFTPCGSSRQLTVQDDAAGLLAEQLGNLGNEFNNMYVQMDVSTDGSTLQLEQLWRASRKGRSLGCREDLSGLLMLARGSEPYWGVEVRGSREIALLMPTDDGSGI